MANMTISKTTLPVYDDAAVLVRIGRLLDKARRARIPIIYIQSNGGSSPTTTTN